MATSTWPGPTTRALITRWERWFLTRICWPGAPSDIAAATLFLCGKGGSYVTGAILPLDGGQSVQHGMTLFKE